MFKKLKLYIENILVSFDQMLNTFLGGSPDETLSSRIAKKREHCFLCRLFCNALDLIDSGHCDRFIEVDEGDRDVLKEGEYDEIS